LIKEKEEIGKNHLLYHLDNGLRVIYTRIKNTSLVHCGYIIGTGSRDENQKNNGIAHFIEHTVFKGTANRKSYQILNRIESVGGELNAYTSREKTCFYSMVSKKYFDRSVELLTDVVFNPIFPANEIEKEKSVIVEEIEMYEDSPDESIYDDFFASLFPGHPLGYSILGKKKSVKSINNRVISDFRKENYQPSNMVLSIAGNLPVDKVEKAIYKHTENITLSAIQKNGRIMPELAPSFNKKIKKDFQQVHCIVGCPAYSMNEEKKYILVLINDILGGDWMSSRLNMIIREKYAYAYNVSSSFSAYSDSGVYSIQLGTDEKYVDKCIELILKEIKNFREIPISKIQLNRAKRQIFGLYEMMAENNSGIMQIKGKNILDFGYPVSKESFYSNIDKIDSKQIIDVANEILDENKLSILLYHKK
jgi:predicted Zn-dependent peptidase